MRATGDEVRTRILAEARANRYAWDIVTFNLLTSTRSQPKADAFARSPDAFWRGISPNPLGHLPHPPGARSSELFPGY